MHLDNLTLDSIRQWAGHKIASRGKDYWNRGKVQDLVRFSDGSILASVTGTRKYTTLVHSKNGLSSQCTCPFGTHCKHAAALIYQLLELHKSKKLPDLVQNDERMELLLGWDEQNHIGDDEESEEESDWGSASRKGYTTTKALQSVEKFIQNLSESEAKELLLELIAKNSKVYDAIQAKRRLENGDVKSIWREIRQQLELLRNGPDWSTGPRGWGYVDTSNEDEVFTQIEKCLGKLNKLNDQTKIVSFGKEFFLFLSDYIPQYDHDGETYGQADGVLKQLDLALQCISFPGHEKLAIIDKWAKLDEYDTWEGPSNALMKSIGKQDWNHYINGLIGQLNAESKLENLVPILQAVLNGLPHSSIRVSRLELLEKYAKGTSLERELIEEWKRHKSYAKLSTYLVDKISEKGIDSWKRNSDYDELESALIADKRKADAIALRRDHFVVKPSLDAYQALIKLIPVPSQKKVRDCAKAFLETGLSKNLLIVLPGVSPVKSISAENPKCKVKAPHAEQLYQIALEECNVEGAVRWYDFQVKEKSTSWDHESDRFVDLIAEAYPDRALTFWKRRANGIISQTNPRAYEDACKYLEKLIRLCQKKNQMPYWKEYEANLRVTNKRKVGFIRSLDALVKLV